MLKNSVTIHGVYNSEIVNKKEAASDGGWMLSVFYKKDVQTM